MFSLFRWSLAKSAFLAMSMIAATITPITISAIAQAQTTPTQTPTETPTQTQTTSFSDVSSDYWASPFIQALAQRNVIIGFTDGTFKPDQPVTRAQFAAMIQKAFNQTATRQLSQGGFRDVPAGYWAASAIQEAYETGFMSGYPNNLFLPNQQIPKVQAIVALTSGLGLNAGDTTTNVLSTYYSDAAEIPAYAVNNVGAATQANLVVNYPELKVLNPNVSVTRAEAAALLYQALVRQGQLQPLASNFPAANYIVAGSASGTETNTSTTTTTTTTSSNIVAFAGSNSSFSTLTTALKAAGLTETLQGQGPYTVFAPTDEAFAALPQDTVQKLLLPRNKEILRRILTYHVVSGQVTSAGEVRTLSNKPVNVQLDSASNQITVNNTRVIQPIQTSNGLIYAINEVLIPPDVNISQLQNNEVSPGRATLGGSSYIGVAGNIGLGGDSALSEPNFAVISKLGLTRNISVRPSAVFGDDTTILVPITLDFAPRRADAAGRTFGISPYVGAGVAIEASGDADVGLLLTGGIDIPLGSRFTATGAVNAAFLDQTDVGLLLGVGFNF
ncbi:S-layer homology domain-containing protein [Scytonema hofmannii FACHB-248]|uniref:S-layer homology domain-containing protein n=1 Tax=Scytonema hofmannii FACHB-248 TaxID=1842502 RepID=A0ABR8H130_9CYAN|nr:MULTISPECIES: S-layer homology domain-containing protein [Nostocales]MBD2609142.1 S-layer homology domain-containing protein [Scytonema hofmannii FACHB-248]